MADSNFEMTYYKKPGICMGMSICLRCGESCHGVLPRGLCFECEKTWWEKTIDQFYEFLMELK